MRLRYFKHIIIALVTVTVLSAIGLTDRYSYAAEVNDGKESEQTAKDGERVYCVGSVSKVYVTAAVMMLADEGKVDPDLPVTEYIPEFTMADERYKDITVRMLMNHTSGLMGSSFKDTFLYDDNDPYHHDNLLSLLSKQRLKADPGEFACYCNDGFDLLELIVERVSGMSYTDYVTDVMGKKMGVSHTGTALNMIDKYETAPVFRKGNIEYGMIHTKAVGAGGIYATAKDTAFFGTTFYTGNNTLLSEDLKDEMKTRWNDAGKDTDIYTADSALGWDYVEELKYREANVNVMGKGGDALDNHAMLIVAPDEKISVAVLSSGGGSSYNAAMAEALLDVVLKDRGIDVKEPAASEVTFKEIDEDFTKYEGSYAVSKGAGAVDIWNISFDDSIMNVKVTGMYKSDTYTYKYIGDGEFAKIDDYGNLTMDCQTVSFEDYKDKKTYLKCDEIQMITGLGKSAASMYMGQKIDENSISDDVIKNWEANEGKKYAVYDNSYSSGFYETPFFSYKLVHEIPGYIFVGNEQTYTLEKIVSKDEAHSFLTIPGDASRDQYDFRLKKDVKINNNSYNVLDTMNKGLACLDLDAIPVLTSELKEIDLVSKEAAWYRLSGDVSNTTIRVDRPLESSVFVYNKYGEMVYSTFMKGGMGDIPIPENGYIVFLGETGGKVKIN